MADAKTIIRRKNRLKSDRSNWEQQWEDIAHFCIPRSKQFLARRTSGEKFEVDVYDSTARDSAKKAASGTAGLLTNPATQWFDIKLQDPELSQDPEVQTWLSDSRDRVLRAMNASNFYQQVYEFYLDFYVFGTAILYSQEDPLETVRYFARNVREIMLSYDGDGRIRQTYRAFTLTTEQAFKKWGDRSGTSIVKANKDGDFDKVFHFVHWVGPRDERDVSKDDNLNMPWASVWVNEEDEHIILESGFMENPFHPARFETITHETYGFSPAMDVLPEIKSANKIKETIIRAGSKMVDPPVDVPDDAYILPLDFNPAAINFRRSDAATADSSIKTLDINGNIPVGLEILQDERASIRSAFFVDLFLTIDQARTTAMTATEVLQRVEEKMVILGPTVSRLMSELLDPVITRTFFILLRNGMLADVPPQIEGSTFLIEYVSTLAKAQKASQSGAIQNFLAVVGGIAQLNPTVVDKINVDQVVDLLADIMGVDPKIINADEIVQAARQQRAQLQQQAQQLELLKLGADAAKSGGAAAKDFNEAQSV